MDGNIKVKDDKKAMFIQRLFTKIMQDIDIEVDVNLISSDEYSCYLSDGEYYLCYTNSKKQEKREDYNFVRNLYKFQTPKNSFLSGVELFCILHEISHIIQMSEEENGYMSMVSEFIVWHKKIHAHGNKSEKAINRAYRNLKHEAFADSKAYNLLKKYRRYINYLILKIENEKH